MVQPFLITADEVNCLIHAYFQDSGFVHSAFVLHAEAHLDKSPHYGTHVPRGELVELLSKALLYSEVEAHWRGNAMTSNCKSSFSLLERHMCSLDPNLPPTVTFQPPPTTEIPPPYINGSNGTAEKRKASPSVAEELPREKRARTEEMDVDSVASSNEHQPTDSRTSAREPSIPAAVNEYLPSSRKQLKPASDNATDGAITLLEGHQSEVFVCAWNPVQPCSLATGSKNTIINIWNLHDPAGGTGPPESDPPLTFDYQATWDQGDLTSLDWNQDGTLLAAGSYDTNLRVCDASGKLYFAQSMQEKGPIFATRFSKSGQYLLTASLDGTVCVWDVPKKSLFAQYKCHARCCLDVDWLTEDIFASCGADGQIQITRLDSAAPIRTLTGHTNEINQIKCNPSRTLLASCSDDTTARIFYIGDIAYGHPPNDSVIVLSGHSHTIGSMAWCPHTADNEHELLLTASFDGTSRIWDSVTGQCLRIFEDHIRSIYTVTFSPDSRYFATAGADGRINVYDVKTKQRKWTWQSGAKRAGIFEIDWQQTGDINRLAVALESNVVGVIDVSRIAVLQ